MPSRNCQHCGFRFSVASNQRGRVECPSCSQWQDFDDDDSPRARRAAPRRTGLKIFLIIAAVLAVPCSCLVLAIIGFAFKEWEQTSFPEFGASVEAPVELEFQPISVPAFGATIKTYSCAWVTSEYGFIGIDFGKQGENQARRRMKEEPSVPAGYKVTSTTKVTHEGMEFLEYTATSPVGSLAGRMTRSGERVYIFQVVSLTNDSLSTSSENVQRFFRSIRISYKPAEEAAAKDDPDPEMDSDKELAEEPAKPVEKPKVEKPKVEKPKAEMPKTKKPDIRQKRPQSVPTPKNEGKVLEWLKKSLKENIPESAPAPRD